jgi:hypothetical protein
LATVLLANCCRSANLALARQLLQVPAHEPEQDEDGLDDGRPTFVCPHPIVVQTQAR